MKLANVWRQKNWRIFGDSYGENIVTNCSLIEEIYMGVLARCEHLMTDKGDLTWLATIWRHWRMPNLKNSYSLTNHLPNVLHFRQTFSVFTECSLNVRPKLRKFSKKATIRETWDFLGRKKSKTLGEYLANTLPHFGEYLVILFSECSLNIYVIIDTYAICSPKHF